MDHHTREALGWISRRAMLLAGVGLGVSLVLLTASILPDTLKACRSWWVAADTLARRGTQTSLVVRADQPSGASSSDLFFGRTRDAGVRRAGNWGDASYFYFDAKSAGTIRLLPIPNPYSRYLPMEDYRSIFIYPEGTRLLVVDARAVLPILADGRLDLSQKPSAQKQAVLRQLGKKFALLYVTSVPLRQYDQARAELLEGPEAAVLASSSRGDEPGDAASLATAIQRVRDRMRAAPLVITEDAVLARLVAPAAERVFLVGHPAPQVAAQPPIVSVATWDGLIKRLP